MGVITGVITALLVLLLNTGAWAAPTVTAIQPAAGASNVPVSTAIQATFSEPMDSATITTGSANSTATAVFVVTPASFTLTATSDPAGGGSIGFNPPGGSYNSGTAVTITAAPAAGYRFDHWEGGSTVNPLTVTMDANKSVLAHFSTLHFGSPSPTSFWSAFCGQLILDGLPAAVGDEIAAFDPNAVLCGSFVVTETGKFGWLMAYGDNPNTSVDEGAVEGDIVTFKVWSAARQIEYSGDQLTFAYCDKITYHDFPFPWKNHYYLGGFDDSVIATNTHTISAEVSPPGTGAVNGAGRYPTGASATLVATPATGYWFDHWEGDASASNSTVSVIMDAHKSVTAVFTANPPTTYTLSITTNPGGGGSVALNPAGGNYAAGTSVTLTATPASGYKFDHWTGAATGSSNPTTITTGSANSSATAVFVPLTYTLGISVSPAASGSVALSPAGGSYAAGTSVTLTATPAAGYQFAHWTWAAASTTNPVTITTGSANSTVTAVFARIQHMLSVTVSPVNGGSVSGAGLYNEGDTATLTASPASGYHLDHWNDGSTGNTLSVVMSADKSVTAYFAANPPATYTLSVTSNPGGSGSVALAPAGGSYAAGTSVTLTATATAGYQFDHWTGAATGSSNPTTITTGAANSTATAVFTRSPHFTGVQPSPFWADYDGTLTIGGAPAQPGDEVGVFDPRGVLCGQFTVTQTGTYGFLHVYGDAPDPPQTDDQLTFKVWDASTQTEYSGDQVSFSATPPAWHDQQRNTVNISAANVHTLEAAVSPAGSGTVSGAGTYSTGTSATVSAVASAGYQFDHWEGNASGSSSTVFVVMDAHKSVTAVFTRIQHMLSVTVSPVNGGSVSGAGLYNEGDTATLTATTASGYQLDHWSDGSAGSTLSVVMSADKSVTAYFAASSSGKEYKLVIKVRPIGGGSVTLDPSGGSYSAGTKVKLTPKPAAGYKFSHWKGGSKKKVKTVTMNSDRTVTAFFAPASITQYALTTSVEPTAGGSISLSPPGGSYDSGTSVTITATAASGYKFDHWTGAATGTTNPVTITTGSANSTVTAVFVPLTYTLAICVSPASSGSVTLNPAGGSYAAGTSLTLTATAASGYQFDHWTGAATGTTNPVTITTGSADSTATAVFVPLTYILSTTASPAAGGTIALNPAGGSYAAGTSVTLTASPASGYKFDHWGGDASGTTNPATVTMSANKSVTAYFVAVQLTHFPLPIPQPASVDFQGGLNICGAGANPGDEVAAFTPRGTLCGQFTVTEAGLYGSLHVYGDDSSTAGDEGARPGDILTFKVWDAKAQQERTGHALASTGQSPPAWTQDLDYWLVDLTCYCGETISLHRGWNLFSFATDTCYYWTANPPQVDLLPGVKLKQVASLDEALSSIAGKYTDLRSFDTNGAHTYDTNNQQFSDMDYLVPGYGYWIKISDDCTLALDGDILSAQAQLRLHQGWNLVGCWADQVRYHGRRPTVDFATPGTFFPQQAVDMAGLIPNLPSTAYELIRSFDIQGAHTYNSSQPDYNDLYYLGPGYGYWIKMNADGIISY